MMGDSYTIRCSLIFGLSFGGPDPERDALVEFSATKGASATRDDPGYPPEADLRSIKVRGHHGWEDIPAWMFVAFQDDEEFLSALLAEAAERDEDASERAAEARREEQMLERGR
jgi:hypothetical protein